MLILLSLNSVLIHSQCILWVFGKERTLWKILYLTSNLFHETLSLWLCINRYPCTLCYLGQCLKITRGGIFFFYSLNVVLLTIERELH